jgi:hypothetical protein
MNDTRGDLGFEADVLDVGVFKAEMTAMPNGFDEGFI